MRNLIDEAGVAGIRREMQAALREWLEETNDSWPNVATALDERGVAVTR